MWSIEPKTYSHLCSSVIRNGSHKNIHLNLNLAEHRKTEHRIFLHLFKTLTSKKIGLIFHFD